MEEDRVPWKSFTNGGTIAGRCLNCRGNCHADTPDWLSLSVGSEQRSSEEEVTYVASVSYQEPPLDEAKGQRNGGDPFKDEDHKKHNIENSSPKKKRVPNAHNLSEKRRRKKLNQKIQMLQKLLPDSGKKDKASILEEAIDHLQRLQSNIKMLRANNNNPLQSQVFIPHHFQVPLIAPVPSPMHYTLLPSPCGFAVIPGPSSSSSPVPVVCQPQGGMNVHGLNRMAPLQQPAVPCSDSMFMTTEPIGFDEIVDRASCGSSKG